MADLSVLTRDAPRGGALARIDPRIRIVGALVFVAAVTPLTSAPALGIAIALSVAAVAAARLPMRETGRRLAAMETLVVLLVVLLPFTMPGRPVLEIAGLSATREGLARAVTIAVKVNACVLAVAALLSTLDAVTMGHALGRLRVPQKLVVLLLFAVRYIAVLADESERLRRAMRARAFRPRADRRTWRALGWLLGMLMVRSFERAERVAGAMKCRGFDGTFHLMDDLRAGPRDALFAVACGIGILAFLAAEAAA